MHDNAKDVQTEGIMVQDNNFDLERALLAATGERRMSTPLPQQFPSVDEAYAIQRRIHARTGQPIMVWKLGLTGKAPQDAFGAAEPTVGRLPASAIFSDRSQIFAVVPEIYAEAELVFEMGSDLPVVDRPYTRADICAALKGIYTGIEIVFSRFADDHQSLPLLIADNVNAYGLVLGGKLSSQWEDRFADMPAKLSRNDEAPVEGSTARVLGNPLDAVVWLANWLRENENDNLKKEQLIASGTTTGATEIFAGDTISVSFDGAPAARISLIPSDEKDQSL